jgi:predicted GH43/DUF377 family glycosyl hydrolase
VWNRSGLIFEPKGKRPWMHSHACTPTAFLQNEDTIRLLFAPRNEKGQSIPSYLDVSAEDPQQVLALGERPIMTLGKTGTFDDGGIMPCCVVPFEDELRLYYVGWNASVSVPYRNAIGMAVSRDGGKSFERAFPGAVVDRNRDEPYFTASPWVFRRGDTWQMLYTSTVRFVEVEGRQEPIYVIMQATSHDGIEWQRDAKPVLPARHDEEAIARPTVDTHDGVYRMWFCHRASRNFRNGPGSYRIGEAISQDGLSWERLDRSGGPDTTPGVFDAKMQTYPCILRHRGILHLFYNGNGFGERGIGHAWRKA